MGTLLIASSGGHLSQLQRLLPRLRGIDDDVTWITFDGAQSRSLLAAERVVHAHYPRPRDAGTTMRNAALAYRVLREHDVQHAVSTGAGIAFSFFSLAAAQGVRCHYIESATRVTGPSFTGRLVRRLPSIRLYSQYRSWAQPPWHYRGSVFDGYRMVGTDRPGHVTKIVVSVGSSETYGFRRLVERMATVVSGSDAEVIWQTGSTDVTGLPIDAQVSIPAARMQQLLREADVVVTHAGTGSALTALDAGKCPILVPRRQACGEHIDDHQIQICRTLAGKKLALYREAEELTFDDLLEAAGRNAIPAENPPPFELV